MSDALDRHHSPSLLAVAITCAVLFVASVAIPTALAGGQHFPSPFDAVRDSAAYFAAQPGAVRLAAFLQLGAAISLGVLAAAATSRLLFLGVRAAGAHIALLGGIAAAALLAVTAACAWALAQPELGAAGVRALHVLAFAVGGPGLVATSGLLVAGIAATAGLGGLVPRWLLWSGLAIAAVSELSTLTLLDAAFLPLLPIARFSGLAWLIAAGAWLPKTRAPNTGPASPEER